MTPGLSYTTDWEGAREESEEKCEDNKWDAKNKKTTKLNKEQKRPINTSYIPGTGHTSICPPVSTFFFFFPSFFLHTFTF